MGYRSDVTIIMYPSEGHKDKFAALKLYVDENLPDEFAVIGEGYDRYLHCFIDGRKWYDGYDGVQQYNKAFSEWEDMFKDEEEPEDAPLFHYEFMRIGEEWDDVDYHCSDGSDNLLDLSREVFINR